MPEDCDVIAASNLRDCELITGEPLDNRTWEMNGLIVTHIGDTFEIRS